MDGRISSRPFFTSGPSALDLRRSFISVALFTSAKNKKILRNQDYNTEDLVLSEDSNGQIVINNLRVHRIIEPKEIYALLKSGKGVREKNCVNPDQVGQLAHTVLKL